jgi:DNA-binding CsgD family transcriptional regulator
MTGIDSSDDGAIERALARLPARQRAVLLRVKKTARTIADIRGFKRWIRTEVKALLPHRMSIFAKGNRHSLGFSVDLIVPIGLPTSYVRAISRQRGVHSPVVARWLRQRRPQLVRDHEEAKRMELDRDWIALFRRFNLGNVAAHGTVDEERGVLTCFAFYGSPVPLGPHHGELLSALAPCIHEALIRAKEHPPTASANATLGKDALTEAEREVCRWLKREKTNWEIANLLGKSQWTVKTQVQRIMAKLGARTRAEAAALFPDSELRS